jgi:hypothetical protein
MVSLWEFSYFLKLILPEKFVFHDALRLFWILRRLFSRVEETHVPVDIKPFVLDPVTNRTLFCCENCSGFCKEYFLHIRIYKVEKGSFSSKLPSSAKLRKPMNLMIENNLCYKQEHLAHCLLWETVGFLTRYFQQRRFLRAVIGSIFSKRPTQLSWRNSCIFQMIIICVRNTRMYHFGSLWELLLFLKGILSGTQVTQDGDRLTVFQIGLFRRVAETHTSLEINHVC